MKYKNLFSPNKLKYVLGKDRPAVDCILCSIINRDSRVKLLEITRTENFVVAANLYPFNAGHLLIFPVRHVEDICDFTGEEALEMHNLLTEVLAVLRQEYNPGGFNIGYNIGRCSGASIPHVHMHIVPRYERELGFADIVGGAKLIVENPSTTMKKLKKAFKLKKGK